jgi:membrane-associated phospholipid phosphatase
MGALESGFATDVVVWFQSWATPVVGYILYPFHYIGGPYGYLALLPIVYWAIDKRHGKRLIGLALGSALIAGYLKFAFARPRPVQVAPDRVTAMLEEPGYGIPSGHTLFATAMGGYAWYRVPRLWVRIVAAALVMVMALSRIIHGLHFPQDVIAGLIFGIGIVAAFWWLDTRYLESLRDWSIRRTVLVVTVFAAIAFVGALLLEHDYEHRKDIISVIGAMIGGLTGFALEHRYVRFSTEGAVREKIVRTVVGLVVTFGVFFGLDVLYDVIAGESTGTGVLVVYAFRYALVALVAAAGAPYLFVKLGLARTE